MNRVCPPGTVWKQSCFSGECVPAPVSGYRGMGCCNVFQGLGGAHHNPTSTEVRSPTSTSTEVRSPTSTSTEVRSPTSTSTEVRSPTSTSTEVRSPTSTSTEVRSPTSTSTDAYTRGNITVTGGAGAGATSVHVTQVLPAGYPERPGQAAGRSQQLFAREQGRAATAPRPTGMPAALKFNADAPRPGGMPAALRFDANAPRPGGMPAALRFNADAPRPPGMPAALRFNADAPRPRGTPAALHGYTCFGDASFDVATALVGQKPASSVTPGSILVVAGLVAGMWWVLK